MIVFINDAEFYGIMIGALLMLVLVIKWGMREKHTKTNGLPRPIVSKPAVRAPRRSLPRAEPRGSGQDAPTARASAGPVTSNQIMNVRWPINN